MNLLSFDVDALPEPSVEFRTAFDAYLELCKFKLEEKLGILFFLGATLPGTLGNHEADETEYQTSLQIFSLYSKSTGDFEDYPDLDDAVFNTWIYNANLAISKITGDATSIDENLRTLPHTNVIVGKMGPKPEFLEMFKQDSFNLNAIQNLNDEVFMQTGLHLKEKNYSFTRAYEAGFAYRMLMLQIDIKGTHYLLSRIHSHLSPLFQALFYAPRLYVTNPHAFKANHLFSQILNNFYGGTESGLFPIAQSIHKFHQFAFYKANSTELKEHWLFNKVTDQGSALRIFAQAQSIRETNIKDGLDATKFSKEVYNSSLINASININDFLTAILEVIKSKYAINGYQEFIDGYEAKIDTTWNNKGDYIQFLVILFYETCLHALVVKEIK
jgi:hypothetical protein